MYLTQCFVQTFTEKLTDLLQLLRVDLNNLNKGYKNKITKHENSIGFRSISQLFIICGSLIKMYKYTHCKHVNGYSIIDATIY